MANDITKITPDYPIDAPGVSGSIVAPVGAAIQVASAEAERRVQARMLVAMRCRRDIPSAMARIKMSCARPRLAEVSHYSFPRGNTVVKGPTIRLAEEIARNWGNIDFGFTELERHPGRSLVQAYAWDLETNVESSTTFVVEHAIWIKPNPERGIRGGNKVLVDPRDIYEKVANEASRRIRACILRLIPGDVVEFACDECDETLKKNRGKSIQDSVRDMLIAFQSEHGVTREMIEGRLGHKAEVCNETELVTLRRLFQALRDGMAKASELFDAAPASKDLPDVSEKVEELKQRLGKSVADEKALAAIAEQKRAELAEAEKAPPADAAPEPKPIGDALFDAESGGKCKRGKGAFA